jgi:hypothetical protein
VLDLVPNRVDMSARAAGECAATINGVAGTRLPTVLLVGSLG